ncbi:MAG TPA: NAD(+)/NADH kinase [Bacteroidales bacterium]|nr:NAD(+)/NADH kinase [Bacteroidales bacterium]
MSRRIALFSKDLTEKTMAGLLRLIDALDGRGAGIWLNIMGNGKAKFGDDPRISLIDDVSQLPDDLDLIISVGGDGTFLETAMKVRETAIPIAGINTGRLGFLANIPDDDIIMAVEMLCSGQYEIINRSLLEVIEPENLFGDVTSLALNEVTVQKVDQGMITITVHVNDIFLNTYRADGLIISSSTGSTAYSLSVGGPILSPSDESIIIVPMSPHNLTVRPIIVTGGSIITMQTGGRSGECMITCDSKAIKTGMGTNLVIRQPAKKLQTITLSGNDFFSTIRGKLMWGADPRN